VPHPHNVNIIKSIWIFHHKTKSGGSFKRHKARLGGDGSSQQVSVGCDKVFSSMVKSTAIQTVLSIALSKS